MKTLQIFSFSLLALFLVSFTPTVAKKFPATNSLKSLDGKAVNIQSHFSKNKLTVVSFWATWCSPCKKELDAIKDLYPDWQKMGVEVIAVTMDNAQKLGSVKPTVAQKGWTYTVLSDVNSDLKRDLNFQAIPQTFVVNAAGEIVYSHSGYTPGDEFELEEKLKSLLK